MTTLGFILRISIAAILGGAIGFEREYRAKEAGFRTHFLVAMGAALFTLLSAYGFQEVLQGNFYPHSVEAENLRLDVSRIAAQVVTGIGFIGGGIIIFQRPIVRGLTTAAGLWATGAIGMAVGCGMYTLATFATILILLVLEISNRIVGRFSARYILLVVKVPRRETAKETISLLEKEGIEVESFKIEEQNERLRMSTQIMTRRGKNYTRRILHILEQNKSIEVESIK